MSVVPVKQKPAKMAAKKIALNQGNDELSSESACNVTNESIEAQEIA